MFKYFDYDELKKKFPNMLFFTSMDLAVSRKQSADYTAIITIGVDNNKNWYVVQADYGRLNPTQTLDVLFKHVRKFSPLAVGAENAALQQVLDHFMQEKMVRENTFFTIQKLKGNSSIKKEIRIAGLHPRFNLGKIWFPKGDNQAIAELEHELMMMTKEACLAQHDDLADCLANFTDEDFVFYPGENMGTEIQDAVDEFDFDDYLDNCVV
jgi:phage terminase large subunit-like protein